MARQWRLPGLMEITNTGTSDYTFPAGGVIVQTPPGTSDLIVDIDLTGVTIRRRLLRYCDPERLLVHGFVFGTYGFDPDMTVNSVWARRRMARAMQP